LTSVAPTIRGDRVTLRPFRQDELDLWYESSRAFGLEGFPAGPPTRAALRNRIGRSAELSAPAELDLAIEVDARAIGAIQTQLPHPLPPHVFQVGIGLFSPEDRGQGYGSEAMSLFVDWLFGALHAERVQAGTTPANAPMRRVFDRLGFVEEESILVFGQRHLLYAIERREWERRREGA
jgi:RimJ/RimL family protein N-acetyltransferase